MNRRRDVRWAARRKLTCFGRRTSPHLAGLLLLEFAPGRRQAHHQHLSYYCCYCTWGIIFSPKITISKFQIARGAVRPSIDDAVPTLTPKFSASPGKEVQANAEVYALAVRDTALWTRVQLGPADSTVTQTTDPFTISLLQDPRGFPNIFCVFCFNNRGTGDERICDNQPTLPVILQCDTQRQAQSSFPRSRARTESRLLRLCPRAAAWELCLAATAQPR